MTIPQPAVSEVCPTMPVQHFGESRFNKCKLHYTWDDLYDGYHNATIAYRQGSLGVLSRAGRFETYACIKGHPCADLIEDYFCFVYDEVGATFVPWGPNTVLKLLALPMTQDEVIHLRAKVQQLDLLTANLSAAVANLTDLVANLTARL